MKDTVSLRDVYDAVNRLEDKLDKRLSEAEEDIENIKGFQNKALGVLSVLFIFSGSFTSYVWNRITGNNG